MAIPQLNQVGLLPEGIHEGSVGDLLGEFGHGSLTRVELGNVLHPFFENAKSQGARYAIVGGSFVTSDDTPSDVDIVLVFASRDAIPDSAFTEDFGSLFLDVLLTSEEDQEQISALLQLLSVTRHGRSKGVVRVGLTGDDLDPVEQTPLREGVLEAVKATYLRRSLVRRTVQRGVLVTLHGIRTEGYWSDAVSLEASLQGWVIAPFHFGRLHVTALMSRKTQLRVITQFREWIYSVSEHGLPVSIIAHSFGTYVLGRYLLDFDEPPVAINAAILTGSILSSDTPWDQVSGETLGRVLNEVAPNDPWVKWMPTVRRLTRNSYFGSACVEGFSSGDHRIENRSTDLFDHGNVIRRDVLITRWMPFLNAHRQSATIRAVV